MKIVIVDDEALARKRILKLLVNKDEAYTVYEASSGKEAIAQINKFNPDLVFLDIQMTDMSGFDVLERINSEKSPIIIFVTAYDVFAVKAFEVQAFDFLLKPFNNERFLKTFERSSDKIKNKGQERFKGKIDKLISYLKANDQAVFNNGSNYWEKIVIKTGKKYYFLDIKEIKFITSSGYYAEIFTMDNSKHVYRISMSDFMKNLSPELFSRVNRSTILRLSEIKEVISEGLGDYSIILKDATTFSLSKKYKNSFLMDVKIKE